MIIQKYLEEKKLSRAEFARITNTSPSFMTKHLDNGRRVSPEVAKKIEDGTKGEIKAMDLILERINGNSEPLPGGQDRVK